MAELASLKQNKNLVKILILLFAAVGAAFLILTKAATANITLVSSSTGFARGHIPKPQGIQKNDVIVVYVTASILYGNSDQISITPPSGYTLAASVPYVGTSRPDYAFRSNYYYKVATDSDTSGGYDYWNSASTSGQQGSAVAAYLYYTVWRGVDNSSPIINTGIATINSSIGSSNLSPSVQASKAGDMIIAAADVWYGASHSWQSDMTALSPGGALAVAYQRVNSGGAHARTFTIADTSGFPVAAHLLSLRAATTADPQPQPTQPTNPTTGGGTSGGGSSSTPGGTTGRSPSTAAPGSSQPNSSEQPTASPTEDTAQQETFFESDDYSPFTTYSGPGSPSRGLSGEARAPRSAASRLISLGIFVALMLGTIITVRKFKEKMAQQQELRLRQEAESTLDYLAQSYVQSVHGQPKDKSS